MNDWQSGVPVGELMSGEITRRERGVCTVFAVKDGKVVAGKMREVPDHLIVRGEGGHHIGRIPFTSGDFTPREVDAKLAGLIEGENNSL